MARGSRSRAKAKAKSKCRTRARALPLQNPKAEAMTRPEGSGEALGADQGPSVPDSSSDAGTAGGASVPDSSQNQDESPGVPDDSGSDIALGPGEEAPPSPALLVPDSASEKNLTLSNPTKSEQPSDSGACCGSVASRTRVETLRLNFHSWDREKQNQWLFSVLLSGAKDADGWDLEGLRHRNRRAWCRTLGVAIGRVARLQKAIASGCRVPPVDGGVLSCRVYPQSELSKAHAYCRWLYEAVAEPLAEGEVPEAMTQDKPVPKLTIQTAFSEGSMVGSNLDLQPRYLAPGTLAQQYDQFCQWWEKLDNGQRPSSMRTFTRAFSDKWKFILRFRGINQHAKCAECCRFAQCRRNATTLQDRTLVARGLAAHLDLMRRDRHAYREASLCSENFCRGGDPADASSAWESILTVCLDGMDQAKFCCPRHQLWSSSKESEHAFRPQLHFLGAITHGLSERFWVADADLQKDAASTCELLARLIDEALLALQATGKRPKHLWCQLDNTTRENRNSLVLSFLAVLVGLGYFSSTAWQGMMVGHTHIDQDQRFSVCGASLAWEKVLQTPDDFVRAIQQRVAPARGRTQIVERYCASREWSSFLGGLHLDFHGHAGKGTVHSYTFVLYKDLLPDAARSLDLNSTEGRSVSPNDVCLLARKNIADASLSQPPLRVMCAEDVQNLAKVGVLPSRVRSSLAPDLVQKYRRTAAGLAAPPWNLHAAAD